MRANRVLGDVQPSCDLVGAEVLVEQEQNLDLARGELLRDLVGDAPHAAALANTVEQSPCDRAGKRRLAVGDPTQKEGDALRWLALQQVAGRPGANGLEEVLVRAGRRQDDDFALGRRLADVRQGREPVHAGHRQIEQHEPGAKPPRLDDRLGPVGGLSDDVEPVLSEEGSKRLPCERVIVGDQDALHIRLIGSTPPAE